MRKSKIKIKQIKSKVKIIEKAPKNPELEHETFIEQPKTFENIESKTKSSSLPLLKKGEVVVREVQQPGKKREQKKDEEHIFVSYDRFGMSAREKQRVYSQDLRTNAAPIRQTATIERGNASSSLSQGNLTQIHSESSGDTRRVDPMRRESAFVDEELRKYAEEPDTNYKSRKREEFY